MLSQLARAALPAASRAGVCWRGLAGKTTTGIVGYEVEPEYTAVLKDLYGQTLEQLAALPADSEYRKNVEAISNHRLKVISTEADIDKVEDLIGIQVEEMIQDAKDELELIPVIAEWKPWAAESGEIREEQ